MPAWSRHHRTTTTKRSYSFSLPSAAIYGGCSQTTVLWVWLGFSVTTLWTHQQLIHLEERQQYGQSPYSQNHLWSNQQQQPPNVNHPHTDPVSVVFKQPPVVPTQEDNNDDLYATAMNTSHIFWQSTPVNVSAKWYETSSLYCPGCRHFMVPKPTNDSSSTTTTSSTTMTSCGILLEERMQLQQNEKLDKQHLFHQLPEVCQRACACAMNTMTTTNNDDHHRHHHHHPAAHQQQPPFRYWRFDKIWTTIDTSMPAQSYFLTSVPKYLRAPNTLDKLAHFNITRYMEELWNRPIEKQHLHHEDAPQHTSNTTITNLQNDPRTLLFEFNPSVVALPPRLRDHVRQAGGWTDAVYVASFRVSGDHNCVPWYGVKEWWDPAQWQQAKKHNFLGLALLNSRLELLDGSDIVVDLQDQLVGPDAKDKADVSFIDFRLFVLHERVYLNINGPPVLLVHIDLHWATTSQNEKKNQTSSTRNVSSEFSLSPKPIRQWTPNDFFQNANQPLLLSNKYDHSHRSSNDDDQHSPMQLVLQTTPSILEPPVDDILYGKNFALFATPDNNGIAVEYQLDPHIVRHVETHKPRYYAPCQIRYHLTQHNKGCAQVPTDQPFQPAKRFFGSALRRRYWPSVSQWYVSNQTASSPSSSSKPRPSNGTSDKHGPLQPSFATLDELWFNQPVFKTMSHGGACCVSWKDTETGKSLLIGVGHRKVPIRPWMDDPNLQEKRLQQPPEQYASYLYAFEAQPPYRMVAQSGLFCLPFATPEETERVNAYHRLLEWDHMRFMGQVFDCARITFVSGITEHATDSSKAIISYGINDCTSRIMMVSKKDLARLLFEGMAVPTEAT